jgi:hypothetical protein
VGSQETNSLEGLADFDLTRRTTSCPAAVKEGISAEPTRPEEPLTKTRIITSHSPANPPLASADQGLEKTRQQQ